MKKISILFLTSIMPLFVLAACQSNSVKQSEQTENNKASQELTETVGYIDHIDRDATRISISSETKVKDTRTSTLFDTIEIDESTISTLKIGDRVRVTCYKDILLSDPPMKVAANIEKLKE